MKKKKLGSLDIVPRVQYARQCYEMKVQTADVDGAEHLSIDMYYSMNEKPTYRIFLNHEDYITWKCFDNKWSHASILELIGCCYIYDNNGYWKKTKEEILITPEELEKLKRFTGYEQELSCEQYVDKYQEQLRRGQTDKKNSRVTDKWDRELGELPELPKDWNHFLEKEVTKHNYVFYERTKSGQRGICEYCNQEVNTLDMRHNGRGYCPHCGKYAIWMDINRKDHLLESREVWIAQHQGSRIVLRTYIVEIKRDKNLQKPAPYNFDKAVKYWPYSMVVIENGKTGGWIWGRYKNSGEERWCSNTYEAYKYYRIWPEGCMYRENVREWLPEHSKYLPLDNFPYDEDINPALIINNLQSRIDAAEKLMKIGLWSLGTKALEGILKPAKRIQDILKVENDDLGILKAAGADYDQYRFFQNLKKLGKRPAAEELIQYKNINMPLHMIERMIPYTTFHQIYRRYRYNSRNIIENYYKDYFSMCKELEFDMKSTFVLFPKNIKKAHDDLVLYYNEKKDEVEGRKRNRIYAKVAEMAAGLNELYGVEDEEYFIRAPRDAAEIIREGHAMHHCVGGKSYTEKMTKGQSCILFIRKKSEPEKSWYTLEIGSDHTVVQVQGFANKDKDRIRETSIWKLLSARLKELKEKERVRAVAG